MLAAESPFRVCSVNTDFACLPFERLQATEGTETVYCVFPRKVVGDRGWMYGVEDQTDTMELQECWDAFVAGKVPRAMELLRELRDGGLPEWYLVHLARVIGAN